MTILIFIVIGLGAGVLSGLLGIGGGIVVVPALIYFAKFQPQAAAGTSLGVLVIPIGAAIGALTYYKAGNLDVKASLIIAAGLAVGAAIGSHFGSGMDATMLKKAFAVFLVLVAAKMWVG